METQRERMKLKKKKEKEGFEKRSRLQHLNGLHQFHKSNSKRSSNLSTSSSASVAAPNVYPRFLLSSNSSSDTSLASSSSRPHRDMKPKTLSSVTNNVPVVKSSAATLKMTPRSKENVSGKPFLQKSKKPCVDETQLAKTNTKPTTYGTAKRSKLCRGPEKKVSSEDLAAKVKRGSGGNGSGERFGVPVVDGNMNSIERCTPAPAGKIVSPSASDSMSFDDPQNVREDSVSTTPPVEASVSPELQYCGSHSKMLLLVSVSAAATPVCYGAGHLLSGVADNRKCRRRGSLGGGCAKVDFFNDEENDRNVISSNTQDSSIPLLSEASVHWLLLSPCDDEGRDCVDQGSDLEVDQCEKSPGYNASLVLDFLSSPSCADFGNNNNNSGGGSLDDEVKQESSIFSPGEFHGFLGHSNKKKHEPWLAAAPNSTCECSNIVNSGEWENVIKNSSASSLSSGDVIWGPNSDWSSYPKNVIQFETDSIADALNAIGESHSSEMSIRDAPPSLSFQCSGADSSCSSSIFLTKLQKNGDSVCSSSSVSDSTTLENLALSQMREGIMERWTGERN